jgi:hypothetical protein
MISWYDLSGLLTLGKDIGQFAVVMVYNLLAHKMENSHGFCDSIYSSYIITSSLRVDRISSTFPIRPYLVLNQIPRRHTLRLPVELRQLLLHSLFDVEALHQTASPPPQLNFSLDLGHDLVNLRLRIVGNTQKRHLSMASHTIHGVSPRELFLPDLFSCGFLNSGVIVNRWRAGGLTLDKLLPEREGAREEGERSGDTDERVEVHACPYLDGVGEAEEDEGCDDVGKAGLGDQNRESVVILLRWQRRFAIGCHEERANEATTIYRMLGCSVLKV